MKSGNIRIFLCITLVASCCWSGCGNEETKSTEAILAESLQAVADEAVTPPKETGGFDEAAWAAEVAAITKDIASGKVTRNPRVVIGKFLGFTGKGDKRRANFKLENTLDKKIKGAQSWVYYYDAEDKYLDRYPHAFSNDLDAAGSVEITLGMSGDKLEKNFKKAAVELSRVDFQDGTQWINENLEQGRQRKPGGATNEELMKLEGEMVLGKWTGQYGDEKKPTFKLTNISGRPLKVRTIWIYYYDENGKYLDRDVANVGIEIGADATVDFEGGTVQAEIKESTKVIEISVSKVTFGDGAQEEWENRNLSSTNRPMRTAG